MGTIGFHTDGAVAVITLCNSEFHNAVDAPMRAGLESAYERVDQDESIRVAVITGEGQKSFTSGGHIDGYLAAKAFGPGGCGPPAIPRPWPARKPYIAAINGYALGGGFALALACDLRIVGRSARLGPSGLRRGSVQGATTIQRLTRLIGASRALQILLLSRYLTGDEADKFGLAEVADDADVMRVALDRARTIASFDPWTVEQTKALVYDAQHLPLGEAISIENAITAEGYRREAALEGFTAFQERREPRL